MCAIAGILTIAFLLRMWISWRNYFEVDHTAGTWIAMAMDARSGVLYRPIFSSMGYGGTRYMPLHALAQMQLMNLGLGPVASGYALGFLGVALVVGGLYALMRQFEIPAAAALPIALLVLATSSYRTTVAGINGDLLPNAFNLWGLAAIVGGARRRPEPRRRCIALAAACFMLAIATKMTSVFGIAASAFWLIFRRQWRAAIILTAAWSVGVGILLVLMQLASHGRAMPILTACASGGGGFREILAGPHRLFEHVFYHDRSAVGFWLIAMGLLAFKRGWQTLPGIYLVLTSLGTLAIYCSPGTSLNHVVDVAAASVLMIGFYFQATTWRSHIPAAGAMLLALAVIVSSYGRIAQIRRQNNHARIIAALADANRSPVHGPLLSQNPIFPIIQGQQPYLLDSFMFRTLRAKRPGFGRQLWQDLARRRFSAVILDVPPNDPILTDADGDFGPDFVGRMQQSYHLSRVEGHFYVYLPNGR